MFGLIELALTRHLRLRMLRGAHALPCFPYATLIYVVVERNISRKWRRRINLSSPDDETFDWPKQSLVKPMCRDYRWVMVTTSRLILQSMPISTSTACWERNNVKPLQPLSISHVDGTFRALQHKTSTTNSHFKTLRHEWRYTTTGHYNKYPFVTLRHYNLRPQQ